MTTDKAREILGVKDIRFEWSIAYAYRNLIPIWHPNKHQGSERVRRLVEEKAKE